MEENNQQMINAVLQAKQGSEESLTYLYEQTYWNKYYLALKYAQNEQDAQDIVQEAYIKAFEGIKTLEEPEKFNGWLSRIVTNTALNYIKKKKPMLFSELVSEEDEVVFDFEDVRLDYNPEAAYSKEETSEIVNYLLNELSVEQRMTVIMFYLEGLSIKDIAVSMECNENTVKSRLNYARKNLLVGCEELRSKGYQLYSASPIVLLISLLQMEVFQSLGSIIYSGYEAISAGTFATTAAATSVLAQGTVAGGIAATGANAIGGSGMMTVGSQGAGGMSVAGGYGAGNMVVTGSQGVGGMAATGGQGVGGMAATGGQDALSMVVTGGQNASGISAFGGVGNSTATTTIETGIGNAAVTGEPGSANMVVGQVVKTTTKVATRKIVAAVVGIAVTGAIASAIIMTGLGNRNKDEKNVASPDDATIETTSEEDSQNESDITTQSETTIETQEENITDEVMSTEENQNVSEDNGQENNSGQTEDKDELENQDSSENQEGIEKDFKASDEIINADLQSLKIQIGNDIFQTGSMISVEEFYNKYNEDYYIYTTSNVDEPITSKEELTNRGPLKLKAKDSDIEISVLLNSRDEYELDKVMIFKVTPKGDYSIQNTWYPKGISMMNPTYDTDGFVEFFENMGYTEYIESEDVRNNYENKLNKYFRSGKEVFAYMKTDENNAYGEKMYITYQFDTTGENTYFIVSNMMYESEYLAQEAAEDEWEHRFEGEGDGF